MQRILTGIQCTGKPHLGNILGAMLPAIKLSDTAPHDTFIFLADLHTLTTLKDAELRKSHVQNAAAAWLALGLDPSKVTFYRQSRVPALCELLWYLTCFTPFPMLANAHAFKDKSARMAEVSAGLFIYPVLMAADILLYQADKVPVGRDQLQHIEIARDIAQHFNHQYGSTLQVPEAHITQDIPTIPGTDGQKMSKSYNNTIDIFLPEAALKKSIMGIKTDSTPQEAPKNPDTCIVFQLYRLLATPTQQAAMRNKYLHGGYGYGQAKIALLEAVLEKFAPAREKFIAYNADPETIEHLLQLGEKKAEAEAVRTLHKVKLKIGY